MLQEPMIEKLLAMRLHGMADALKTQEQDPGADAGVGMGAQSRTDLRSRTDGCG